MNCHEARGLFSAKVDDLATREQRSALDGHLQRCADCAREWERFRQTVGLLHSVTEARAPAGFARRVVAAPPPERWHRRLLRGIFLPLHVKLPLEAAALVLVSTLVIVLYRQTPEFQRAVEAPPSPGVTAAAPRSPPEVAQSEASRRPGESGSASQAMPLAGPPQGALQDVKEKDRLEKKPEAAPAEPESVGGRMDASREARKSAAPAAERKLAARAQGPFHLLGLLRPTNREGLDSQLGDLVKQIGGILVRDAERVGPGSIVEVVVPRDAYPRLLAGLRQIGDFTVETRARTLPDQMRIGIRIAE